MRTYGNGSGARSAVVMCRLGAPGRLNTDLVLLMPPPKVNPLEVCRVSRPFPPREVPKTTELCAKRSTASFGGGRGSPFDVRTRWLARMAVKDTAGGTAHLCRSDQLAFP